jgi:hypothetical protein
MRRYAVLLFSLGMLAGFSGCAFLIGARPFEAAIIRDRLPPQIWAQTICSHNNLPVIVVDEAIANTAGYESVIQHEQVHVRSALAYRGGCWPFYFRYRKDKAFRAREEFKAYCEWGRFLLKREGHPDSLWAFIQRVMTERYDAPQTHNCLFGG